MNKPRSSTDTLVRISFLVLMAVLALFLSLFFLAVFAAVVGWYIWKANDRIAVLEQKLADREKKPGQPASS